jgi:hypothetical protein
MEIQFAAAQLLDASNPSGEPARRQPALWRITRLENFALTANYVW